SKLNLSTDVVISKYFSEGQRKLKSKEELFLSFVNDCFMTLDFLKLNNKDTSVLEGNSVILLLKSVCFELNEYLKSNGFRDYTDQLIDVHSFFEKNKSLVPEFDHVLVDEFQDVNVVQNNILGFFNA